MNRPSLGAAPVWARRRVASLIAAFVFVMPGIAMAADNNVVRVEEDWELVLTEPDLPTVAPQVTCTIAPYGDLNSAYWTFEINHESAPFFGAGGLHIHQWHGEWRQGTRSRIDRAVMSAANDTVAWTQVLRIGEGQLTFEVKDGTSSTWGVFGDSGNFKLQRSWGVAHINGYTPDVSVANSGVGFASNRVASLKLKRVRYTLAGGQVVTDNTERVVFVQE